MGNGVSRLNRRLSRRLGLALLARRQVQDRDTEGIVACNHSKYTQNNTQVDVGVEETLSELL